jgi:polysaccharide export outer membrane protein
MTAAGKTVAQLKQEIEGRISRYVSNAGLTVEVKQSNSMLIYVIGRVNSPGRHTLLASTNVLQALAMAGGPNPFANTDEIRVFRTEGGKTVVMPFDYEEVTAGRRLETNIILRRGDVIIVP